MSIQKNTAYKINPEFDTTEFTYFLAELNKNGAYFHIIRPDGSECENWAWFNQVEINDGVLIEASKLEVHEKIEHRKKQIASESQKIELCRQEIETTPKSALSVFVVDMIKRKNRYEANLNILLRQV